jgi:hypothetical protein
MCTTSNHKNKTNLILQWQGMHVEIHAPRITTSAKLHSSTAVNSRRLFSRCAHRKLGSTMHPLFLHASLERPLLVGSKRRLCQHPKAANITGAPF